MSSILDIKHNLLFIHIPKTAGSSITDLICPDIPQFDGFRDENQNYVRLGRYHWSAQKIKQEFPDLFLRAKSFAIVRNPFSWLQSIRYYQAASPTPPHHQKAKELSFTEFIRYFIEQDHRSMKFFVCDSEDQVLVDHVLKFEDFQGSVLPFLARHYDLTELRHKMKTEKKPLEDDYDLETFNFVRKVFSDDISLFGYEDFANKLEDLVKAKNTEKT